jgi:hypothetical protein
MKKLLLFLAAVVVLLLVAALVVALNLNSIIKKGVETAGPRITQVDVKLDAVAVEPLAGNGVIKGLVIGNPPGYKTPSAVRVGEAKLSLVPKSIMADKIVIRSLVVKSPEITIEGSLKDNNLTKILDNIDKFTATEKKEPAASGSSKKLQVDEFVVSNAKVNVNLGAMMLGQQQTVTLPEIRLTQLGTGPEGITSGELAKLMFNAVIERVIPAVQAALGEITKGATQAIEEAKKDPAKAAEKAAKGLDDLLNKKK